MPDAFDAWYDSKESNLYVVNREVARRIWQAAIEEQASPERDRSAYAALMAFKAEHGLGYATALAFHEGWEARGRYELDREAKLYERGQEMLAELDRLIDL